jgi:hypothetical protein
MTAKTHEEVSKVIFDDLIAINVNDHTEKKGQLTYLSWAWAYVEMMKRYPTFTYRFDETEVFNDGTAMVNCTTQITMDGHEVLRTMWLPVMNYANKAVSHPDSMALNTAKMRCLTKCISMHGLGAYIYAGEDLPEAPQDDKTKTATPKVAKKKVAKKVAAKKPEPAKVVPISTSFTVGDAQFEIPDADGAVFVTDAMIQLAKEMHSDSMENLVSFWKNNGEVIEYLNQNYSEEFTRLKEVFTEIKTILIGEPQ